MNETVYVDGVHKHLLANANVNHNIHLSFTLCRNDLRNIEVKAQQHDV